MVIEFSIPFTLVSPLGELPINTDAGGGAVYRLIPDRCEIDQGIRAARDDMQGSDGWIFHNPRFKTGLSFRGALELYVGGGSELAIGTDRQEMFDTFMAHIDAMLDDSGRIRWQPDNDTDERMIDELWTLARPIPGGNLRKQIQFAFESPFPYAINKTQTTTSINGGATDTLDMIGNVRRGVYPVIHAHGATSAFTIENQTTGLLIEYDDSLPGAVAIGGGDYVEIDTFRNTVVLNGDVDDRFAGINALTTDFWTLIPGDNVIAPTGCNIDVLWNHGWA